MCRLASRDFRCSQLTAATRPSDNVQIPCINCIMSNDTMLMLPILRSLLDIPFGRVPVVPRGNLEDMRAATSSSATEQGSQRRCADVQAYSTVEYSLHVYEEQLYGHGGARTFDTAVSGSMMPLTVLEAGAIFSTKMRFKRGRTCLADGIFHLIAAVGTCTMDKNTRYRC